MCIADLRSIGGFLAQSGMCFCRCIMDAAEHKDAHSCLPELCKACCYKAAIPFIRHGCIKEVTRLYKKIHSLSYSKISCLLKGAAQSLLAFFTLAWRLTKGSVA